ncbi:multidrug resistance protein 2-like isoform X1 [Diorhabda carinulata]|uniref:multidrug resistance protein 2-like isoform X1 n=1 Tax=Diorhabda carinulata TaxID=1163345 RepID=UPI0025A20B33|nr:multidrug resistance protein 2-like isoform X1 [Diorhabda carinulata]
MERMVNEKIDNEGKRHPFESKISHNPKNDLIQPVSFFGMFRYATQRDKFLMFIGIVSSAITGILQPLSIILFGRVAGDSIDYAQSLMNDNLTPAEKLEAENIFLDGVKFFATWNSLIGIGMLFFCYIATVTFNYSAMEQTFRIRSKYLKSILNQDISWYDQNQTGDFASRMSDDLYKFEDGIGEKVPIFLQYQVLLVTAVVVAFIKGWQLALVSVISIPASVISFSFINVLTTRLAKNEMEAYGASASIADEVFSLIRTVTAFGGQDKETKRYQKNLMFARKNNIRRSSLFGIGLGLMYLLLYSSYALTFWYGVKLVLRDRGDPNATYTPENMLTIFFNIMSASLNFGSASSFIEIFGIAKAAAAKIFTVIENEPDINLSKGKGEKLESLKGIIKFKDVKFHYPSRPDVPILQGLNLEIKSGDTVALVGSSGCGKSTVIQLIQRFYNAISGEITIDDTNINKFDLTWLRNRIGVVGQEPILFGTTIMENIKYGKQGATDDEALAAAKKANAHDFIKRLPRGYNTLVGERGTQLSGGQKQRIAIARALIRKPNIMLLDEATSALDNASEAKVQAALDLASEECTTIIVAHRLSTIQGANKIIVLSQGVVVEEGTHDQLMALKNEYYKLVTAQVTTTNEKDDSNKKTVDKEEIEDVDVEGNELDVEDKEINDFKKSKVSLIQIIKLNAPEWPYILVAGIAATVVGCGLPAFSVLYGSILGTLANSDSNIIQSKTNNYCLYIVGAGVICLITAYFQLYLLGIAGEKMTERIRAQMFKAIISQDMEFFDKKSNGVGSLCARLSGDPAQVQGATGQRVGQILQSLATLVVAIGLSLYYEWKLALVTAAFLPVMALALFVERRNTAGINDTRDQSLEKSTKIAVEAIGNIRTVASLVAEDMFHRNYINELTPHYKLSLRSLHSRGIIFGMSRSISFFAYAASLYYGGFLIIDGLYYDRVFKVAQIQLMGIVSVANSFAFSPNLMKGINAARRIITFMSKIPQIRDGPNSIEIKDVKGDIKFSSVNFSYPTRSKTQILRGLDLNILNGKTVALVGESGCGKSTIIQLIERFYDPTSGNVQLDDFDIKSFTLSSLRSHLGIVSQEPNLFNKTIGENIAYGDNSRVVPMDEIIHAAKCANIHNFVSSLPKGYDTKLGEKAVQLSGGQKQRIAIARALVRNPKILLLDEATSALDTESEKIVQEALDGAKKGRTCITIAHRLTTIQDADLICVVDNGAIVESGTHKELLNINGIYHKLYTHNR